MSEQKEQTLDSQQEGVFRGAAIVTGALGGIGQAIALALAKDGYAVAINGHSEEAIACRGEALQRACQQAGQPACCYAADMGDYQACEEMVRRVEEDLGKITVLVNNAGITRDGLLVRMKPESFDAVTQVNYNGVFYMTQLVGKRMVRHRAGRIINITSVAGIAGNAGQFNYAASKAGVIGMTKSAAKELGGRGVRVNAVAPGFIRTPMTDELEEKYQEQIRERIALKRFGEPEDVASAVRFLASEEAAYINGQVLVVDGCLSM